MHEAPFQMFCSRYIRVRHGLCKPVVANCSPKAGLCPPRSNCQSQWLPTCHIFSEWGCPIATFKWQCEPAAQEYHNHVTNSQLRPSALVSVTKAACPVQVSQQTCVKALAKHSSIMDPSRIQDMRPDTELELCTVHILYDYHTAKDATTSA